MTQHKQQDIRSGQRRGGAQRRTPFGLTLLRAALRVLARLSPRLAGRWLYRLWFRTHRFAEPGRETRWREDATQLSVPWDKGPLAVYSWGEGPPVLLLHGWNGRATQMGAFAAPLVKAGYRAVALDAPGHGRSPGKRTTLYEIADAVKRVAESSGPLAGIVTHSFGAMVITRALRDGLAADKVICIAPPSRLTFLVESFCGTLGVSPRVRADLMRRLRRRFGDDLDAQTAADLNAAQLAVPALIIHDEDDQDVPWEQGERLARAWPGARFMLTHGLGHARILRHHDVTRAAVEFLSAQP